MALTSSEESGVRSLIAQGSITLVNNLIPCHILLQKWRQTRILFTSMFIFTSEKCRHLKKIILMRMRNLNQQ